MKIDEFICSLEQLNINFTGKQLFQLEQYYELLVEWNEKINLTTIIEKEQVYLKHFYDSVSITQICDLNSNFALCDLGSGAGFPGIVIKIFFPEIKITLVDSLNKRIQFLNLVISTLQLKKIEAIHTRIEEYGNINRNQFDYVTARAVSHLSTILEYGIPLLKIGGKFIALKGNLNDELLESVHAMHELNCKIEKQIEFDLPNESGHRTILSIGKRKATPKKYPRKYSEIKKNRL